MLLFLDTEFTDFDDCDLISVGLVSEDGKYEFYAERTDYRHDWANSFVRTDIIPHLGRFPGVACTGEELTRRLWAWFGTLPRRVQLACDSARDHDLLWSAFVQGLPPNLDKTIYDLRGLIDTTVFHDAVCRYHEQPDHPWHHAFHDASAHRAGWMAWMDHKRNERPTCR
ncbi:3'-5' exoribonuclease [Azoarcus sp. DN11]|uniref:3'-5' exoribonuclease n=1 Tax=Azoarcus sp. DN11 TaxID=356837 RepID=UPI000EABC0FF|nr:3'-5' exoribonuclease [Azoarcus sp. DN11]AYH41796.1 hypothetical protein CDA09_00075 [Azoarcus sp. DN11]